MNLLSSEDRFWTHVDKCGECWEWTGCKSTTGYGKVTINRVTYYAHRVAYEMQIGQIPEGMVVDHVCRNRLCVNASHLRTATTKQNSEHRSQESTSVSGFRGVTWRRRDKRWEARVRHHGKRYFVGNFHDLEDAKRAVLAKRLELFTHNNDDRQVAA